MNLNTEQKIALALMATATAVLGYIGVLAFLSDRAYRKTAKKIEAEKQLDLEALRITQHEMKEAIANDVRQYHTVLDLMMDFNDRLKFNQIAVRNK